jgi:hypothetical protein
MKLTSQMSVVNFVDADGLAGKTVLKLIFLSPHMRPQLLVWTIARGSGECGAEV